jgi:hypothetical protein
MCRHGAVLSRGTFPLSLLDPTNPFRHLTGWIYLWAWGGGGGTLLTVWTKKLLYMAQTPTEVARFIATNRSAQTLQLSSSYLKILGLKRLARNKLRTSEFANIRQHRTGFCSPGDRSSGFLRVTLLLLLLFILLLLYGCLLSHALSSWYFS